MKIRTCYNYDFREFAGVINDEPSMTVPDQSLTVREILQKFTNNTLPPIAKQPQYEKDPNFDSISPARVYDYDLADYTADYHSVNSRILAAQANGRNIQETEEKPANPIQSQTSEANQ